MRIAGHSLLLAGALTLLSIGTVRADGALRVIHSDPDRLELEWTLDRTELVPLTSGSETWRRPEFPGALHVAPAGEPDVPSLIELVGVPRGVTPTVRVTSVTTQSEIVRDLAPAPEHYVEEGASIGSERRSWSPEARRVGARPAQWASLEGFLSVRGNRLARLQISPWRYDPSSGELQWASRMRVVVELGGSSAPASRGVPRSESAEWERTFEALVLNPGVARRWRAGRTVSSARGTQDSFASSPNWVRIPITEGGVYRLDYFTFANLGLDPATIDPTTIRIFSGSGLELPNAYSTSNPSFMTECAALDLGDGDSIFDLSDRLLFYALPPHGWASEFDPARERTEYVDHRFDDVRYYWVTWGGFASSPPPKRMGSRDVAPGAGPFVISMPHREHFEQNNVGSFRFPTEDGWFWEDLEGRDDRLFLTDARGTASAAGLLRVRLASKDDTPPFEDYRAEVKFEGPVVALHDWTHSAVSGIQDVHACVDGLVREGRNDVRMSLLTPNSDYSDEGYLAWIQLEYDRQLRADNGVYLKFFSDPVAPAGMDSTCNLNAKYGSSSFHLSGFDANTNDLYLLDVSNQHDVVRLTNFGITSSGGSAPWDLRFSDPFGGSPDERWYVAFTSEGVKPTPSPQFVNIRGLHQPSNSIQYVVIYHPDVRDGAARLAALRASPIGGSYETAAISVDEIYNEFSWGVKDPVAIRDFLAYALASWTGSSPLYAVFLGDAAFDSKGYLEASPDNMVPSYLDAYRTTVGSSTNFHTANWTFYTTEDWYGYLEEEDFTAGLPALDVAIGRYPTRSSQTLDILIDKLEIYLTYESPGQWQNRVIMVADDERVLDDDVREPLHTRQVEALTPYFPPALDKVKVYLTEFPRNDFGKKPEAQEKFIEEFNRGALMTTYSGHGDQNTMAQEEVFVSAKIPELANEERYTVFSTFSCTVSKFDLLSGDSLTELLLNHDRGGALTTFSSGGLVFPGPSSELNKKWLQEMYGTPYFVPTTARSIRSIGWAALGAKLDAVSDGFTLMNAEKYVLLGDPALNVRFGRYLVQFEQNTVATDFTDGLLRVVRGSVVDSTGAVLDGMDSPFPPFNGTALVHVTENSDDSGYDYLDPPPDEDPQHIDYILDGPTSYRGEVPVVNGRFEAKFYLSESVLSGDQGRVSVFALQDDRSRDASGAYDSLRVAPTISRRAVDDDEGPSIRISFEGYEAFVDGDMVFTDRPALILDLEDEHGINLRPFPQFARLEVKIDGEERIDLGEDFTYVDGTYTRGRVRRVLLLGPGEHIVEAKAFDSVANRGEASVRFTVVLPEDDLKIVDGFVSAFPNPFVNSTHFVFRLTQPAEIDLKIFTVTGRGIYEATFDGQQGENFFPWDGRDRDGGPLANGTYLYKVEATYTDPEGNRSRDEFTGQVVRMR